MMLAAPAMAGSVVGNDRVEVSSLASLAPLTINSGVNLNFDVVDIGDQTSQAYGSPGMCRWPFCCSAPAPSASNSFNLEKHQTTGTADNPVINLEVVKSGHQSAKAFGSGQASNTVNLLTTQE